jgi:transposase-like protein
MYRRRSVDAEIIETCVRWYITYRLSYRDLVAMMAERGVEISHTTICDGSFATPRRRAAIAAWAAIVVG